jgi:hypothetical protein
MRGDLGRAINIVGIYLSFSVGLVLLFVFNDLITDDIGTTFVLALSIFSIALLIIVISCLTSNWMGQTCDYKLQSAYWSTAANLTGVVLVVFGLAIVGIDFSDLVIQILMASGGASFVSSLIGSYGRDVPFSKPRDEIRINKNKSYASRNKTPPPSKSFPASSEENGYEWLQLEDGTTWWRVAGGFPEPNGWEFYNPETGEIREGVSTHKRSSRSLQ